MRTVVFVAPFPLEATMRFGRAAASLDGVRLVCLCQEPPRGVHRRPFADIVTVPNALDAGDLVRGVELLRSRHGHPHRIVGILEPLQVPIALCRAHFEVPGTDPNTADLFRNKARMKDRLREAGLPVAKHALLHDEASARAFIQDVGFPMVLKPPAGMGAKATFRVHDEGQLFGALRGMGASAQNPVLGEEMLRGTEGSCDTVTIDGRPRMTSVSHYLPPPLEVLETPWVQWRVLLPRVCTGEGYDDIREMTARAIDVLGLVDGVTHLEWFRREDGSLAIGEIAQRPAGAQLTLMTGLVHGYDPFRAWARAVIDGRFDGPNQRNWAAGCVYLRGIGRGRVTGVTGVREAHEAIGQHVVDVKLPQLGAPKSDSYEGDGWAVVRHEDTAVVEQALSTLINTIRVHYG